MSNIEIGIDLGTTNSEIAIFNNGAIELVKNTYGDEFTPSVFGVSKAKNEEVGKKPYQRYFKDATSDEIANNKPEIKRLMGTSDKVFFSRINKSYNAEEISSKILESLKQDAIRKNENVNTSAVVITIPAHFSTIQAEATKKAGILAGFKHVVLLQEPIAAAVSYGFGKTINENWLIYDLGGGTFDSALISSKDGNLKVLSHNGDNFLGGKDIDAKIVDEIIVPYLQDNYDLDDFDRSNPNYAVEYAKLKYAAEQAKIQLSHLEKTDIEVDIDVDGENIYENIPVTREELENVLSGLLDKTIELCKETIKDAGIKKESVNKIVLVGGPTQLPFIKTLLESSLGISVDTSSDPLTAVARGACVYAAGQVIPKELEGNVVLDASTYEIILNYESLTSDEDELVTGTVPKLVNAESDYFIEIKSYDNTFNTGKIKLRNGKFAESISVKPNRLNTYEIKLFDDKGYTLKNNLNTFNITHGLTVSNAPIPYSIGIGVSVKDFATNAVKQEFEIFFAKNSTLPLSKTMTFKTIKTVTKGDAINCLPITVYEGEYKNPEHNGFICEIELTGKNLGANLYEGSQVDITIEVDESRVVTIEAYIPSLDKSFDARGTIYDENISVESMKEKANKEINKLEEISSYCTEAEKRKIQEEIEDIEASLIRSENDEDERRKTNVKIKKLQSDVEKLQESKENDVEKATFYNTIKRIDQILSQLDDSDEKTNYRQRVQVVKDDGEKAIANNNMLLLKNVNDQLKALEQEIAISDDKFWLGALAHLSEIPAVLAYPGSEKILSQALAAVKNGDMNTVKKCVIQLIKILPSDEQDKLQGKIAGITR